MRSLSSRDVICNISMRWRNCGVSTSRWERLVVNLRDIPQIRLPYTSSSFRIVAACGRMGGLYPITGLLSANSVQTLCSLCLCSENCQPGQTQTAQRLHRDLKNLSHAKLFAEVKPAYFCVFGKFAWVSGAKDLALRHYIRAVRYAKCFAYVVIGNEYSNAAISQVEYYILNIIYCFWIDARKRLVEQNVLRLGCQSSCYF